MFGRRTFLALVAGVATALALGGSTASASTFHMQLRAVGAARLPSGGVGNVHVTRSEVAPSFFEGPQVGSPVRHAPLLNPSLARSMGLRPRGAAAATLRVRRDRSSKSWQALNVFQERYSGNGNQFTFVPPDQGLCAGNGYVFETLNDVIRVYRTTGTPATAPITSNQFFGYPPIIDRTTGVYGPEPGDPSCYFDPRSHRWFNLTWTFEVDPATGDITGYQHLDLAVSWGASPLGSWRIYRLPSQNNGEQGTPNHHCSSGFCESDYPHIGGDANGIYITTNEYGLADGEFHGAQLYAIPKAALLRGASHARVLLFQNLRLAGHPGFTVWPSIATDGRFARESGGTEFFLSSNAAPEAEGSGVSRQLGVWALTHTETIGRRSPRLRLLRRVLDVPRYSIPPQADQKPGTAPLRDCLNDTTMATPFGPGCWQYLLTPDEQPTVTETLHPLDTNDSRMQQTVYSGGLVWGALDTGVRNAGHRHAGIAWYAVAPRVRHGRLHAGLERHGTLGVTGSDIAYPAVGPLRSGKAAIAVTLFGPRYYPSAAWIRIGRRSSGPLNVLAPGAGPYDSFDEYRAFDYNRPRWGDYGAAVPSGRGVWIASEYIAQRCTLDEYVVDTEASPFGTCGMTRAPLSNWSTRISRVRP